MKILVLALALCARPAAAVEWTKTHAEALAASKASGKPILADFQAPWCYSCYYMERHVLEGARFAEAAKGFVALKLDVDTEEGHALKATHAVSFLPSYVVLAPGGGKELGRVIGEQTEDDFLEKLSALASNRAAGDPESAGLRARLAKGDIAALEELLARPADCQLPYDVDKGAEAVEKLYPEHRSAVLKQERQALERLAQARLFAPAKSRCADFRSGVEALASVLEKLGDSAARRALLAKTVDFIQGDGASVGEDRSRDDNLRFFLELKGEEPPLRAFYEKLIAAYPADYVYAYRLAKHLNESGDSAGALPWVEKADRLAYGANRLMVTKVRAKILAAVGRREEAVALLRRDVKAGKKAFPKEAGQLEELAAALSKQRS